MKKISISIPEPCHEDWNAMTPQDKGRFCASCQKTVVDFSQMSDRQIAAFFKKPAGSVCGRFHSDQLHREIVVSKKHLPWAQALFQYTWPAFVLFLKSCAEENDPTVVGKIAVQEETRQNNRERVFSTLGIVLTDITPVDSSLRFSFPTKTKSTKTSEPAFPEDTLIEAPVMLQGDVAVVVPESEVAAVVAEPVEVPESDTTREAASMDTVVICSQNNYVKGRMVAGAVSVVTYEQINNVPFPQKTVEEMLRGTVVYPNPVRAGGQLTVSLPEKAIVSQYQMLSTNGGVVSAVRNLSSGGKNIVVSVPASLSQGTYYLRLLTAKGESETIPFAVIN